jgi:starvation-inducible DNA-binding protein
MRLPPFKETIMAEKPSDIKDQTEGARLHKTNNDTKNNAKAVSMEVLQARMADSIDLALVTKQAHWNLKGPQFIGVHLMLDGFRTEQDEWTDMMAERITQLGGTARGTVQEVNRETSLKPYPTDIYAVADHIKALIERYAACANAIRKNIDDTDDAGDAGTADLLTEISRGLDKQLWFLEAHTQEPSGTFRN